MPLETHKALRASNLLIKAYDLFDYALHRFDMKFRHRWLVWKRGLYLGDRVSTILVMRLASIGDVVRSTAVVRALAARYPGAQIDYLTSQVTAPVLEGNPDLRNVYTLEDLPKLGSYDWIINLQRPDPPTEFLASANLSYPEVLRHLSSKVSYRFFTGRRLVGNRERTAHTSAFYCRTELEELFLLALLQYRDAEVGRIAIHSKPDPSVAVRHGIVPKKRHVGIFIGSNSAGGDDQGFRTYSMEYLDRLATILETDYCLVFFGTAKVKAPSEMEHYGHILRKHPRALDLVDKTSLRELIEVLRGLDLVVSCDSGPLHIAMALGRPVVGLFVNSSSFKLAARLPDGRCQALDGFQACFRYNWRWKFHCLACSDRHYRMYGCNLKSFERKVDLIPVETVQAAILKASAHD